MVAPTKGDLYCNMKWLHKMANFSETVVTDNHTNIELILLSRHRGFKSDLRISKTKFKKISAEHLNDSKDYCLKLCEKKETMKDWAVNYHILFVSHHVKAVDMIKYMNIMINKVTEYYYPKVLNVHYKYDYNNWMREDLRNKWVLALSNSFNEEYMESQYDIEDVK